MVEGTFSSVLNYCEVLLFHPDQTSCLRDLS